MAIKTVALKNGPFLATGDLTELELTDANRNRFARSGASSVTLPIGQGLELTRVAE